MAEMGHACLDKLFGVGRTIWNERGDLRERFEDIESLGYWSWLVSDGFQEYPELGELIPIPPAHLMKRVHGRVGKRAFHDSAVSDAHHLFSGLQEGGFDLRGGGPLLDFGCGCGRVLRVFARLADSVELHAVDVDREAIDWCTANLDFARFVTLDELPPTPYPDGFFSGVYSFSVFTHLPMQRHRAWLEELHRITRSGSVLVLTVAGLTCFDRYMNGEIPSGFPGSAVPHRDRRELLRRGFLYYPYGFGRPWHTEDDGNDSYGLAFVLEKYVRAIWLDLFELVALYEAPQQWQDYVVLRRK